MNPYAPPTVHFLYGTTKGTPVSNHQPQVGQIVADPKRPYKAYVAAAIAVAITIVQAVQAQSADGVWSGEDTTVTILAFLSTVLVYFTENPKIDKYAAR